MSASFQVRSFVGNAFVLVGKACWWVSGLLGFIVSLAIVADATGFWGFVIAFVIAPITFFAAPWYALVKWGSPFPLMINYGGPFLGLAICAIGEKMIPPTTRSPEDFDALNKKIREMTLNGDRS